MKVNNIIIQIDHSNAMSESANMNTLCSCVNVYEYYLCVSE